MFYVSWRLWEVHLYVFYVSRRLWGELHSKNLSSRVGPLKKDLTRAGGGEESGRLREAQSIVFYTLRAGPPTQLTLVRVSF